jgi:hypothetical protein
LVPDTLQTLPKNGFTAFLIHQLEVDADEVLVCRQNFKPVHAGWADCLRDLFSIDQNIVNGGETGGLLDAEAAGTVSLRIGINQEHFHVADGQRGP